MRLSTYECNTNISTARNGHVLAIDNTCLYESKFAHVYMLQTKKVLFFQTTILLVSITIFGKKGPLFFMPIDDNKKKESFYGSDGIRTRAGKNPSVLKTPALTNSATLPWTCDFVYPFFRYMVMHSYVDKRMINYYDCLTLQRGTVKKMRTALDIVMVQSFRVGVHALRGKI